MHGFASRPPTTPSLSALTRLDEVIPSMTGDVRNLADVEAAVAASRPEVIFHLAAQALVNRSLVDPVGTYSINVAGTVNLLEAVRTASHDVGAVVCVTSDKCYVNRDWDWGYRENDELGGLDPYSSSKACQELVAASYRDSLMGEHVAIATARAGNVIGGGDWAEHRLVPDVMQAAVEGRTVTVRNPESVRPWQHVLNPLSGYVCLAENLAPRAALCRGLELLACGRGRATRLVAGGASSAALAGGALSSGGARAERPARGAPRQARCVKGEAAARLDSALVPGPRRRCDRRVV